MTGHAGHHKRLAISLIVETSQVRRGRRDSGLVSLRAHQDRDRRAPRWGRVLDLAIAQTSHGQRAGGGFSGETELALLVREHCCGCGARGPGHLGQRDHRLHQRCPVQVADPTMRRGESTASQ